MTMALGPLLCHPTSHRCLRTIHRGDFAKLQQECINGQRRERKYLVATDLSDEAAHAMEWTVGTVLRDGDTMLAIYCVDEDTGMGITADNSASASQSGTEEIREQAAYVAAASAVRPPPISSPQPSPLGPGTGHKNPSLSPSPSGRAMSKAEQDRHHAVQDITDRVSKLLRKTRLQVRVVIEVIHCKSPKHLILEVIDYIAPTLVILGSRGRSNLKGLVVSNPSYLLLKYIHLSLHF